MFRLSDKYSYEVRERTPAKIYGIFDFVNTLYFLSFKNVVDVYFCGIFVYD